MLLPSGVDEEPFTEAAKQEDTGVTELSRASVRSFEEVYEACFPFVWRTARRMGVPEDAMDDVCQEVFVVVHRRLSTFEARAKIETWIYRIVANVVRNHRRTQRRRAVPERCAAACVEADEAPAPSAGPELQAQSSEAARMARRILMSLSEPHRLAFSLVELEGMTYQEAADSLGESVHAVRARVRAAREDFERLARRLQNLTRRGTHG